MPRKLLIRLEGASPDLGGPTTGGVSLRFFSAFAKRLRDAYQRSAQAVLTGTVQDTGRFPNRVNEVDIRLVDAGVGSLNLDLCPVDATPQPSLDGGLAEAALDCLVAGLGEIAQNPEAESVPKALRLLVASVPNEVRQRYAIERNGIIERQVDLTSAGVGIAPEPVLASADTVRAVVRGAVCLPRPAVILDTENGRVQANATAEWVERAWAMKERPDLVATIVVSSTGTRLLAIRTEAEQAARARTPSVEETLDRFDGTLRILAQ